MAFKLYVGNYPFTFTREDIQNLFHDFDGIEIDKIIHSKAKSKSYSFLRCRDIDQVVSVIKTLNGTSVSGRTLIVRASDESLQEYVTLILQNDESAPADSEASFVPMQVMRSKHRSLNRRDDSGKLDMCNKSNADSMYSENISPKIEKSAETFENNSQKCFKQKNEKSDYDKFKSSSSISSKCSQNSGEMFQQSLTYSPRRDNFVRSGMYDKADGMQSEDNVKVNDNKSQNYYLQKNVKGDTDQFKAATYSSGRTDFVRSSMHYKADSTQYENVFPKIENNGKVNENKSQKYDQQRNMKRDSYQIKTTGNNSPRCSEDSWEAEVLDQNSSGRDGFVKFGMHSKSYDSSMQFENVYPESEYDAGIMGKNSHKPYHHKSIMSDYNQFTAGNSPRYSQNSQEMYETNSTHSSSSSSRGFVNQYKYPSNIDNNISRTKNSGFRHDYHDTDSYTSTSTWVSVSNFRLGTSIETFYNLFYDYDPLKVIIICNTPRRDKTLTEAHVCFPNRDIADDVIMNFDNTILEGRVILVNDIDDSTIMDELLDLSIS